MEVSKDVRSEFTDLIRVRNPKAVLIGARKTAMIGSFAWPRMDGVLIKVEMVSGNSIITAIVDTGSQLNVARGEIARRKIPQVVDTTCVINMNDANGGSGQLRGMIRNAELACGGLKTKADLWVSEQAPFDLLLGRPWQRQNKVSIDERREGTYLVFKDPITDRPRFELLAAVAEDDADEPAIHYQSLAGFG
ncbi:CCHC-type domain-containing protein [Mycena indigotica]|uniref:CCHC-type domain-containing protein n=1 Tax=Mycena indigotica TaxID=2126181 RepID=A0A8H6SI81_9AGAR|nr:CCHC-type domain-containing protein [Mycena indigotica]KAF7299141.1 CCHC-type domain-containing protein [Mycena indigotica]